MVSAPLDKESRVFYVMLGIAVDRIILFISFFAKIVYYVSPSAQNHLKTSDIWQTVRNHKQILLPCRTEYE
jgi:hypothetical protein